MIKERNKRNVFRSAVYHGGTVVRLRSVEVGVEGRSADRRTWPTG